MKIEYVPSTFVCDGFIFSQAANKCCWCGPLHQKT